MLYVLKRDTQGSRNLLERKKKEIHTKQFLDHLKKERKKISR